MWEDVQSASHRFRHEGSAHKLFTTTLLVILVTRCYGDTKKKANTVEVRGSGRNLRGDMRTHGS